MKTLIVYALTVFCCACSTTFGSKSLPATIEWPNQEGYDELRSILAQALGQSSVRIGETIFSETFIATFSQPDLTGRVLGVPRVFHLYKRGESCFIEDKKTAKKYKLKNIACSVIDPES